MKKYRYTVVSDEYVGTLTRLCKTGRMVKRPAQALFNPQLHLFGLNMTDRRVIEDLEVGGTRTDTHGDVWERIA